MTVNAELCSRQKQLISYFSTVLTDKPFTEAHYYRVGQND